MAKEAHELTITPSKFPRRTLSRIITFSIPLFTCTVER